jgi:hypothetical protein
VPLENLAGQQVSDILDNNQILRLLRLLSCKDRIERLFLCYQCDGNL